MAERTISTKLAIDGEQKYKQALQNINSSLRELRSELKLVESQYKGNSNSIEALTKKGEALKTLHDEQEKKVKALKEAYENAKKAVDGYKDKGDQLKKTLENNKAALEKMDAETRRSGEEWAKQAKIVEDSERKLKALKNSSDDTTEAQKKLEEKIRAAKERMAELEKNTDGAAREAGELVLEDEKLNRELEQNDKKLDAAQRGMNDWQTKMNNAEAELNDLDREIKENDGYMEEAKKSTDGCAKSIDEFGEEVKDSKSAVDDLSAALSVLGIQKVLSELLSFMKDCTSASNEFESAMAGVAKTTDLTDTELAAMGDAIKEMATEIPLSATEIAGIAESAGQLGVAKEDLLSFSDTMGKLGVATNMTAQDAASMLAQFTAVTGMDPKDYSRLGSTIVDLGNNFATTEQAIVNMAQRIAAAGSDAGLSEREMLALATAVSSVGIRAESGGTNLSKLITKMQLAVETGDDLETWARGAGVSAEEFSRIWTESPIKAMQLFIQNVDEMDQSVADFLTNDLGMKNARELNLVKALVNAEEKTGLFSRALETANQAWEENIALQIEAATRFETTESKLQILDNNFQNLKAAIGEQLSPVVREGIDNLSGLLGKFTEVVDSDKTIVPTISGISIALGTLAGAAGLSALASSSLATNIMAAIAEMATNPVLLFGAAIAGLAAYMYTAAKNAKDANPELKEMRETFENIDTAYDASVEKVNYTADAVNNYIERLKELESQSSLTDEEQKEYEKILGRIQALIPDLNIEIDEQTGLLKGGAEALREQNEEFRKRALNAALTAKITKYEKELAAVLEKQLDAQIDLDRVNREIASEERKRMEIMKEKAKALKVYTDEWENYSLAQMEAAMPPEKLFPSKEVKEYNEELKETGATLAHLKAEQRDLEQTISNCDTVTAEYEGKLEELADTIDVAAESTEDFAEAADDVAASVENVQQATDSIHDSVSDLVKSYMDAYESAKKNLDSQFKLWEKVDGKSKVTLRSIKEAQKTQNQYFKNYSTNLQKLLDRDIPGIEKLSSMFTDMSADSAKALEALSKASDKEIADIIATINDTDQYKNKLAELFALDEIDLTGGLHEILQKAVDEAGDGVDWQTCVSAAVETLSEYGVEFEGIGKGADEGIQKGIDDNQELVLTSFGELGKAGAEALRDALNCHSPSEVTAEIGKNVDEGFSKGIDDNSDLVTDSMKNMGSELDQIALNSSKQIVNSFITELNKINGRTSDTLQALKSTIRSATSGYSSEGYSIGQAISSGMVSGINSKASAVASAARKVVQNAIAAAKAAAAVKSPSRKTMEIFENVGEGMIVGLKNKEKELFAEMDSMTNQAMDAAKKAAESNTDFTELYNSISYPKIDDLYEQSSEPKQTQNITFAPEINIYPNDGQSAEEIAQYTIDKLTMEWDRKKAVWA